MSIEPSPSRSPNPDQLRLTPLGYLTFGLTAAALLLIALTFIFVAPEAWKDLLASASTPRTLASRLVGACIWAGFWFVLFRSTARHKTPHTTERSAASKAARLTIIALLGLLTLVTISIATHMLASHGDAPAGLYLFLGCAALLVTCGLMMLAVPLFSRPGPPAKAPTEHP